MSVTHPHTQQSFSVLSFTLRSMLWLSYLSYLRFSLFLFLVQLLALL